MAHTATPRYETLFELLKADFQNRDTLANVLPNVQQQRASSYNALLPQFGNSIHNSELPTRLLRILSLRYRSMSTRSILRHTHSKAQSRIGSYGHSATTNIAISMILTQHGYTHRSSLPCAYMQDITSTSWCVSDRKTQHLLHLHKVQSGTPICICNKSQRDTSGRWPVRCGCYEVQ